jgi:Ca2+:H+ antiporter
MTLLFDPYESIVLFFTGMFCFNLKFVVILLIRSWIVLIVNYSLQDGKSNWMEGFVLMCKCTLHICSA